MIRFIISSIFVFLTVLAAQPGSNETIMGNVTYITMDQIYSDIGTLKGAAVGDTMFVFRRNEEVGLIVITNVARKSSVSNPLVPITQFQLGDRIRYEKLIIETPEPEITDVKSFGEEKSDKKSKKSSLLFSQNGSISLRYSQRKYSEASSHSRGIGTIQYRAGLTSWFHSKVLVYGRSNIIDRDFSVYQARVELYNKSKDHQLQIGRVFPSNMSGVGATDGLLLTSKLTSSMSVGALAGFQPDYQSLSWNTNIKKAGAFLKNKYKNERFKLRSLISFVSQHSGDKVDREFSYIKFTGDFRNKISISVYQILDVYRGNAIYNRSSIEPTSGQISLRFKLFKPITFSTRFTSRKQVLYSVSSNLLPDSLFVDELRTGWYNSVRFSHDKIGSIMAGFNRRGQSNDSDMTSTYIFANYYSAPIRDKFTLQFSTSYIKNLIITGYRNRIGCNVSTVKFGNFSGEYELYSFGYGNFYNDYLQHSIKLYHTWSLWKSLYGSTSLDFLNDKDYSTSVLYLGLTYKF